MDIGTRTTFQERANRYLEGWTLERALATAQGCSGAWHPTGFVVFRTAAKFDGMPVRIHCWPASNRLRDDGHPPMHTHMWPLSSKVLLGEYAEANVILEPSQTGDIRMFDVSYLSGERSVISPRAGTFAVKSRVSSVYQTNDIHFLPAGAWHETLIPEQARVVTVMVTGESSLEHPLLAGPSASDRFERVRLDTRERFIEEEFGDLLLRSQPE